MKIQPAMRQETGTRTPTRIVMSSVFEMESDVAIEGEGGSGSEVGEAVGGAEESAEMLVDVENASRQWN